MSHENEKYITDFISQLPDFEEIKPCPDHFWELMEVNADRVRQQMTTSAAGGRLLFARLYEGQENAGPGVADR